ncbi:MAG: cobalt-precorrin-6A reductase [Pseudomonadota bacterium]
MKILVLAGTAQARALCQSLQAQGYDVQASLAGATRKPMPLGVPTRVGGFGGVAGLQEYIQQNEIDVLIDATHPFANRMTANAASVDVTHHAILQRPAWVAGPSDFWTEMTAPEDAAQFVKPNQVVFLATGRQTIEAFGCLSEAYIYARIIDPPTAPYPSKGEYLQGRPPFSLEDEIKLFTDLKVDWLIVKNAGGPNSVSKLEAARALGIPVLMLERPTLPDRLVHGSVEAMMEWVHGLG